MLETRAVSPLRALTATLALCLAAHSAAQSDVLPVRSVDLYGSAALDSPDVLAYELLKIVSGQTFGGRDYAAWERWAQSMR